MNRLINCFERVDPLLLPVAVDLILAGLSAWLLMSIARALVSMLIFRE
jgi:hypothetical protein